MPTLKVECYSGYKADERPISFALDGIKFMVEKIVEQWRTPDFDYFRILADDGKTYLLRHNGREDVWEWEQHK